MPRSARQEGLSRRHRYTTPGAFGPVLGGSRKLRGATAVVHVLPVPGRPSRIGVALTRRLVPSSVDRNRLKRTVREAFRRHPVKHAGLDCVVALRARYEPAQLPRIRAELQSLFDRLVPRP